MNSEACNRSVRAAMRSGDPRSPAVTASDAASHRSTLRSYRSVVALAVLLILIDQGSKALVQATLAQSAPLVVIPRVFRLAVYANRGAVGGLGQDLPGTIPMLVVSSVILIALALLLYRLYTTVATPTWRLQFFLALTIAPLASHSIDRLRQGYVVDFLQFGGLPVFNFADVLPHLAVVFLAIELGAQISRRRRRLLSSERFSAESTSVASL